MSSEAQPVTVYGRIYVITNKVNGKQYVGQTIQAVAKRWRQHQKGQCRVLAYAIRKYGKDAFDVAVLDEVQTQDELDTRERFWIKRLCTMVPNGYNLDIGGRGVEQPSVETRLLMRLAHLGKKQTPEAVEKRVAPLRGRPRPKHVVAAMQEGRLAKPISIEGRQRMSVAHIGKSLSEEQCVNMKAAQTARRQQEKRAGGGPVFTEESRLKMRLAKLGRVHSEETKAKMRESHAKRLGSKAS
jgi:group I intron endonuclease